LEVIEMPGVKIIYDNEETANLVRQALSAERKRLELGLTKTEKEIAKFEERYHVSSDTFLAQLAAEDLEGGDEEYVRWAGELQMRDRIIQRMEKLEDVEYVAH
jgi:putative hemolysin